MKFRLLTNDGKESDVFGIPVPIDNCYVSAYGMLVRGKRPKDLAIGESCIKRYALSGQKPTTYKIVRVE
jgi:hypothetical protein